jgi:superfamily I DNA/RNA helicase
MKKKKTMHELCKEFPNKTYTELEKYRNADRFEEAQKIFIQQENEELKEDIGIGHNNPPEDDEEKHEV